MGTTMMATLLKVLGLMALSSVKFFLTPPLIVLSGYNYLESVLILNSGGVLGILIFYYFGEWIKKWLITIPGRNRKRKRKIFTKSHRRIVHIKAKYGLIGLSILTPCVLSIPVGSLLAARYFSHDRRTIPYLIISVVLWSLVLTSFYFLF